ncbi:DUF6502 family protein [Marinicella sp. W31]|uniref:DUF6502 family protein n=1 Tax=Marinicella sp. W31 TaxID=3023713 RepID=UPI0037574FF3
MQDSLMNAIRQMLIQIFRPLVRILLRFNVPYGVVADVLKWTYVDVANTHFGIKDKAPTKSRVAVITGLSRVQVDAQLKLDLFNEEFSHREWHRAAKVLTGWAENPVFNDQYDKPRILPIKGDGKTDFQALVEYYSGGATYRSVLDELLANGAVKKHKDNTLELIRPYYLTESDGNELQKINFLAESAQYLIETIDHNIDPERSSPRFQRIVTQDRLPQSLANIAESYIRKQSQALANDVDAYLEHLVEHSDLEQDNDLIPNIGLGIYFYKSDE